MKTVQVDNKRVFALAQLKASLVSAGFLVENIVSKETPPTTFVYLPDAETKNPTSLVLAWIDPPKLTAVSNKPAGSDGVPEALADGVDKHTLTLKSVDQGTGSVISRSDKLQVIPSQFVVVSNTKPQLSKGQVTVTVGPSDIPGEVAIRVTDPAKVMPEGQIRVRFV